MDLFSTGYTASALVADVATATQTTFASLGPILAVVAGLILAFVGVRYVIAIIKQTGKR